MVDGRIHILTTDEGEFGLSTVSPQLPGWTAIYADQSTMKRSYRDDLRAAGFRNGEVVGHWQMRGVDASGREFILRWATGDNVDARVEAGRRVEGILRGSEYVDQLATHEADAAGVVNYVCCLPDDTVGWVIEQLDERGDNVVVVASVADNMVFGIQLATDDHTGHGWRSLAELGISKDTTIGQMMMSDMARAKVLV